MSHRDEWISEDTLQKWLEFDDAFLCGVRTLSQADIAQLLARKLLAIKIEEYTVVLRYEAPPDNKK